MPLFHQGLLCSNALILSWIQLINNVILVSGVRQNDSAIHIHVPIFQILFSFKLSQNIGQSSLHYQTLEKVGEKGTFLFLLVGM